MNAALAAEKIVSVRPEFANNYRDSFNAPSDSFLFTLGIFW